MAIRTRWTAEPQGGAVRPAPPESSRDGTGRVYYTQHTGKKEEMDYEISETFPALGLSAQDWPTILNGFEAPPSEIYRKAGKPIDMILESLRSDIGFLAAFDDVPDLETLIDDIPAVLLLGVMAITDAYCIHLMDDGLIAPCNVADVLAWIGTTAPWTHSAHGRLRVEAARRRLRDRYGDLDDVGPWITAADRRIPARPGRNSHVRVAMRSGVVRRSG